MAAVQVNSVPESGDVVPIRWVAVGPPALLLPPERHEEIWAIPKELQFGQTVYAVGRDVSMVELMRRQSKYQRAHVSNERSNTVGYQAGATIHRR